MAVNQNGFPIWADATGQTVQDSGVQFHASTHTYYAKPGDPASADDVLHGTFAAPFATLQYAITRAATALRTAFSPITVQLLANTTEAIQLPKYGGSAYGNTNNTGIVLDGGGFSIAPASGVPLLAVSTHTPYFIQNVILSVAAGFVAIEADQEANIAFGSGVSITLPTGASPAAAAILCNDYAQIIFYNPITVSGKGGALFSVSDGAHIHYEASSLTLSGAPTFSGGAIVSLQRGGSFTFTAAMSFTGTVTSASQVISVDGDPRNVFQAPLGITWPAGSTQGNVGGVTMHPNGRMVFSSSSDVGFAISHVDYIQSVSIMAKDFDISHDGTNAYHTNRTAGGVVLGANNGAQTYSFVPTGLLLPVASGVPGTPAGGVLYVDPADNKLKYKGSSGTVTPLANP